MKSDWSCNCSSWRLRELREALPRCALALSDLVKALEAAEFLAHEEGDVQTESHLARVQTLIHLCQVLDTSEDTVVRVNVGRRPWQVSPQIELLESFTLESAIRTLATLKGRVLLLPESTWLHTAALALDCEKKGCFARCTVRHVMSLVALWAI